MSTTPWIGVEFEGTLARCDWRGAKPINLMVNRVKGWRREGIEVRIISLDCTDQNRHDEIELFLKVHLGEVLLITDSIGKGITEFWSSKAVRTIHDTGIRTDLQEKIYTRRRELKNELRRVKKANDGDGIRAVCRAIRDFENELAQDDVSLSELMALPMGDQWIDEQVNYFKQCDERDIEKMNMRDEILKP